MAGKFPGGHALVIGVDHYLHSDKYNVPNTALDAIKVSEVLLDPLLCGYDHDNVKPLYGSSATRQNFLAALESFASTLLPADTLFIYYAGHGLFDLKGRYYLTAHDTQFEKIEKRTFVIPETAISESELLVLLRKIPVKRLVTLFNACHSGNISPGTLGDTDVEEPVDSYSLPGLAQHEILATGEGRVVITSCRSGQKAYYENLPGRMTVFGQALVDGLSGHAGIENKKGCITLFGLYEFLHDRVHQQVHNWWHRWQEPLLTAHEMAGSFPISLYRGSLPASLGEFEPAEPLPPGAVQWVPEIRITLVGDDLAQALEKLQDPQVLAKLLTAKSLSGVAVSAEDKKLAEFYRTCFKRSAFLRYIPDDQILQDYEDAVTDTITAVNTGSQLDRIKRIVLKTYEGKLYFDQNRWNEQMELITGLLQKIRNTTIGFKQSKPGYSESVQVFETINTARVEVLNQFNQILEEAGIPHITFDPTVSEH